MIIVVAHAQQYIAQKSFVGASFGPLSYTGVYSKDASYISHTSFGGSVFYGHRLILPKQLYIRGEVMLGELAGNDTAQAQSSNNIKGYFRCYNIEGSAKVEYEFLNLYRYKFTPYVIGGVGAYGLFDYESSLTDTKASNQSWGIIVPLGGGVKYRVTNRIKVFAEGNYRFFPKNLDNYQGDNIHNPNNYYSLVLGVSYTLQKFNNLW